MDWKVAIYDYLQEVRRSSERYRALILLTLGVVAIILGYVGFAAQSKYLGIERSSLDLLYRVADLFAFRGGDDVAPGNWQLEIARWLAPGVTLFALYEFIKALLSEQVKSFRLQLVGNHVIVCGLGFLGPEIVANFRERGMRVVIIEKEADNPNLDACREMGAITVIGNATDPLMLKKVRVHRARYLFAVTGNDSHNSGIAVAAHRLADAGNARGLTCFVHIVDVGLCSLLKERQIAMDDDRFTLELFNIYQMAGLSVLKEHPPFPVRQTPPDTHLLIIGAGRMGQTLIFHVAKLWSETYGVSKKIKMTIIDREANVRVEALKLHYPSIGHYCDFMPVQTDMGSIEFQRGQFLFEDGRVSVTAVYICMNEQSVGLSAALEVNQRLEDNAIRRCEKKPGVPIVVRTGKEGLSALFEDMSRTGGSFSNLDSFPLIDRACSVDNITGGLNETIARAIHDDYVRNQKLAGKTPETNPSIKSWDKLDETLKESNRNQAVHIREKLRTIGCDIVGLTDWEEALFMFEAQEIEMLAESEHRRFMDERLRRGWTFGEVKDIERKKSPYLVPYAKLPEGVKELDRNAIRALPAALARADLKIVRFPGSADRRIEKEITCETE